MCVKENQKWIKRSYQSCLQKHHLNQCAQSTKGIFLRAERMLENKISTFTNVVTLFQKHTCQMKFLLENSLIMDNLLDEIIDLHILILIGIIVN